MVQALTVELYKRQGSHFLPGTPNYCYCDAGRGPSGQFTRRSGTSCSNSVEAWLCVTHDEQGGTLNSLELGLYQILDCKIKERCAPARSTRISAHVPRRDFTHASASRASTVRHQFGTFTFVRPARADALRSRNFFAQNQLKPSRATPELLAVQPIELVELLHVQLQLAGVDRVLQSK